MVRSGGVSWIPSTVHQPRHMFARLTHDPHQTLPNTVHTGTTPVREVEEQGDRGEPCACPVAISSMLYYLCSANAASLSGGIDP